MRSNSLEMESIELSKASANKQSGLGGTVAYHREQPGEQTLLRAGLSQSLAAAEATDAGFALTSRYHRLSGRFATGKGYEDGDGGSFVDRYSYREDYSYRLVEGAVTGRRTGLTYRGEITYTEDVMFPYLQMDERTNTVLNGSLEYRNNKLYVNHTNHLMDNGLRVSAMSMSTDASNLTIGLTGKNYDLYYRHWNADNEIITPMVTIENHLMPDVNQLAASFSHRIELTEGSAWGRIGVSRNFIGDYNMVSFYEAAHPDARHYRMHLTYALGANHDHQWTPDIAGSLVAEVVSEPPATENLYIAVRRPGANAWWVGNPTLDAPVRLTCRAGLSIPYVEFETFGSHVWNYVNLVGLTRGTQTYRTYANVDANLAGFSVHGAWRYIDVNARYTWAQNETDDRPLVEIPPFAVVSTFRAPDIRGFSGYLRHTYNDAQTRVDALLSETPTTSWHRVDAGLHYSTGAARFALEINNIFDEFYSQHLSYLRNPYSSGMRVYEPGRSVRLSMTFSGEPPI
jgi:iron complex outermembrane receptor protein